MLRVSSGFQTLKNNKTTRPALLPGRTVKRLFTKWKAAGVGEFQVFLDWCNTPREGMDTSPAQRFFGRYYKTLLPTTEDLLKPRLSLIPDTRKLRARKEKQSRFYNLDKHSMMIRRWLQVPWCPNQRGHSPTKSSKCLAYLWGTDSVGRPWASFFTVWKNLLNSLRCTL